ncbi:putative RNA-directed DNA polymerase from transposon X-element [Exaiptasia diaphana]|nr:putative RNA-directed DNA polymerase from transposon X-element [Exaiptasia diaphana]
MDTSPAQRLLGRRCKTRLPTTKQLLRPQALYPESVKKETKAKQLKQAKYYNKGARDLKPLEEGDEVRMRPFRLGKKDWEKTIVVKRHDERSSEADVRDIISSSSNASCQLDPIPTWLLKKCIDVLAPIITRMINLSLVSGSVPENWKVALISPLLKKPGLELVYQNFRPVSNLPFISKTAEKVVIPQVLAHCSEHAPLPNNQSSHRQHHSTETALLKVQNDILLSMDRKEVTLLVLLDLSAAFDTIDHTILADLLERDFGISDLALSWITSFMRGRVQRVTIKHEQSRDSLSSGVPQGSCLGPLLFIMYASRLFHVVEKHLPSVQGYADDTQLYLSFRPTSTLSQDQAIRAMEDCIADVRAWMGHNMLMLNDSKTEFLIIGSRQQLAKISMGSVQVGDSEIVSTSSVRNLGAWFDKNMSMDAHVGKEQNRPRTDKPIQPSCTKATDSHHPNGDTQITGQETRPSTEGNQPSSKVVSQEATPQLESSHPKRSSKEPAWLKYYVK